MRSKAAVASSDCLIGIIVLTIMICVGKILSAFPLYSDVGKTHYGYTYRATQEVARGARLPSGGPPTVAERDVPACRFFAKTGGHGGREGESPPDLIARQRLCHYIRDSSETRSARVER